MTNEQKKLLTEIRNILRSPSEDEFLLRLKNFFLLLFSRDPNRSEIQKWTTVKIALARIAIDPVPLETIEAVAIERHELLNINSRDLLRRFSASPTAAATTGRLSPASLFTAALLEDGEQMKLIEAAVLNRSSTAVLSEVMHRSESTTASTNAVSGKTKRLSEAPTISTDELLNEAKRARTQRQKIESDFAQKQHSIISTTNFFTQQVDKLSSEYFALDSQTVAARSERVRLQQEITQVQEVLDGLSAPEGSPSHSQ